MLNLNILSEFSYLILSYLILSYLYILKNHSYHNVYKIGTMSKNEVKTVYECSKLLDTCGMR